MDFGFDERTQEFHEALSAFLDESVFPAERTWAAQAADAADPWARPPVVEELKVQARKRGLWNLFLPDTVDGAGLSNVQYAPLAELTGHSPYLAPEALNCSAPDTGNMELLARYATPEQRDRWLTPLLAGEIRSAFCMTEPEVASSDAANIETRITRDGESYVVNGRKWWSTGALAPDCELLVVLGRSEHAGTDRHRGQTVVLVPRHTPGVTIHRGLSVFGYLDGPHGGHAEITFDEVRVPASYLLGAEGDGFAMGQARLGPGRVHHCMRLIGMAERALRLLCERVSARVAFGRSLAEQGVLRDWIAESRVRIEQARLLVLKTAWLMDTIGNKGAHTEIQAIKIAVPEMAEWVIDKAIQAHGAAGLSQDTPLAHLWVGARSLRIADGPDEVHRASLARRELRRHAAPA